MWPEEIQYELKAEMELSETKLVTNENASNIKRDSLTCLCLVLWHRIYPRVWDSQNCSLAQAALMLTTVLTLRARRNVWRRPRRGHLLPKALNLDLNCQNSPLQNIIEEFYRLNSMQWWLFSGLWIVSSISVKLVEKKCNGHERQEHRLGWPQDVGSGHLVKLGLLTSPQVIFFWSIFIGKVSDICAP